MLQRVGTLVHQLTNIYVCSDKMTANGIVIIKYTLQYTPKVFASPKTTTGDYLQQAIEYIIARMKEPL